MLVSVLGLWVLGLGELMSLRWLSWATPGVPTINFPSLVVEGAQDRASVVHLGALAPADEGDYLLSGLAATGPDFRFQVLPVDSGVPLRQFVVATRVAATPFTFRVQSAGLPEKVRLRILNQSPVEVRIVDLAVRRLAPGYRLVVPLAFAVVPGFLIVFVLRHRRRLTRYLRSSPSAGKEKDWLVAAVILSICFLVYRYSPVTQVMDSKYSTAVSHYFLSRGSLALPSEFGPTQDVDNRYQLVSVNGRIYHLFPNAPAILNLPFVLAFDQLGIVPVSPQGQFRRDDERRILRVSAACCAALLCALLFLVGRVWLRPLESLAIVGTFAFGTQIYSTMSRAYWSHTWAALLLAGSLYLLVSPRFNQRWWSYAGVATLLSWSYFCRPTMSLSIVGITVLIALRRRRFLPCLAGVGAAWLILFVVHSISAYDSILPPYFLSGHLETGRLGMKVLVGSYPEAVLGTLVSPGRGLFIYVPVYGLIVFAVLRYWRSLPCKGLAATGLVVILCHWQLVSVFRNWWGGYCFGPRLFSELAVWFFVLAALATVAHRKMVEEGRARLTPLMAALAVMLLAASLFINTRGATSRATLRWEAKNIDSVGLIFPPQSSTFPHSRLWNWSYPQFVVGLLPNPQKKVRTDDKDRTDDRD